MLPVLSVTEPQKEKNRLEARKPLNPLPAIEPVPVAWNIASLPYSSLVLFSLLATSSRALSQVISTNSPDPLGPARRRGVLTLSGAFRLLRRALPLTQGIRRGVVAESVLAGVSIRMISSSFKCASSSQRDPQLNEHVNGICLVPCIHRKTGQVCDNKTSKHLQAL